jgi:hypothetical protein
VSFDPRMQLQLWIEGFFALAIGNQLQAAEQAAPADVANVRVVVEALV